MGDITNIIAQQITKHREKLGLSKKALSELIGVAPSTVSGWENGDYAPGADTLIKLCDLFQITLDEIYGKNKTDNYDENIEESNKSVIINSDDEIRLIAAYRSADPIAQFKAAKELGLDLPEPVEPIIMIARGGKTEKIYLSDEVQDALIKFLEESPQIKKS